MNGIRFATLSLLVWACATGCGGSTTADTSDGGTHSGPGAGGGAGSTGAGGSGGSAGNCTAGTVTFHMSALDGNGDAFCVGLQCSPEWVTVRGLDGHRLSILPDCRSTCDVCQEIACPALCVAPQPMKTDGETRTWDGTWWHDDTCRTKIGCRDKMCAAPGRYVATMCAARRTDDAGPNALCVPTLNPTCVDVEFDYPSASIVEGKLP